MESSVVVILSPVHAERYFSNVSVVVPLFSQDFNLAFVMAVKKVRKTYPKNTTFKAVSFEVV